MTPRTVIENYWNTECARNIEAILGCYTEDAELLVPGFGQLVGHDQIRRFYQESIDRFPVLEVRIVGAVENGDQGAFEWRSRFRDHEGREFPLGGVNLIRIRDGKLQKVHVYYDPAEIASA
ncbi:nuclear transport factor 2 family protein [Acidithiobacillus sp. M4-SHS-6]|uniref:nuclear transport factor 2 family protein n=1 Tax=Acidithiobacillus sp. M4-SHS-6 TaxID=3383024 RepID=UPI0039BE8337